MPKIFSVLLLIALLTGCASSGPPYEPPVKNRDRIQINNTYESLANGTTINFQGGQRVQHGNLDKWTTWCGLYVYNKHYKADYVTSIQAGEFEIVAVRVRYESSDFPYHAGRYRRLGSHYRGLPAYYLYHVGMRLTSPDQPDVQALDCYKKWATRGRYYPTFSEIQQALGSIIEIQQQP